MFGTFWLLFLVCTTDTVVDYVKGVFENQVSQ